ncbi:hypothetical protein, partial [Vibrio sp. 10N.222.49.C9]|uniref:hypothetical protein n=1 Tax=Vibrio sp. 10N.222.49.C9 TaxID=3229615 RepID=UPI00354CE5D4
LNGDTKMRIIDFIEHNFHVRELHKGLKIHNCYSCISLLCIHNIRQTVSQKGAHRPPNMGCV